VLVALRTLPPGLAPAPRYRGGLVHFIPRIFLERVPSCGSSNPGGEVSRRCTAIRCSRGENVRYGCYSVRLSDPFAYRLKTPEPGWKHNVARNWANQKRISAVSVQGWILLRAPYRWTTIMAAKLTSMKSKKNGRTAASSVTLVAKKDITQMIPPKHRPR
jgi:hypothetical protein